MAQIYVKFATLKCRNSIMVHHRATNQIFFKTALKKLLMHKSLQSNEFENFCNIPTTFGGQWSIKIIIISYIMQD